MPRRGAAQAREYREEAQPREARSPRLLALTAALQRALDEGRVGGLMVRAVEVAICSYGHALDQGCEIREADAAEVLGLLLSPEEAAQNVIDAGGF